MNFFEENLRSLEAAGRDVRKALAGRPRAELTVRTAANGSVTAVLGGVYLHSRFDPEKEARRLAESGCPADAETAVIFGFGLAYHIEAFFDLHPDGRAVVVEPEPDLFAAALEVRGFGRLFARKGLTLLLGVPPEEISGALQDGDAEPFGVIRLRPACARNPEYFAAADEALSRLASRREINLNTLKRFGRLWVRNLVRNIRLIRETPGVRHLEGAFAGIPAVVLAAGPSLDRILPLLPEIRRRCVLIAVDTSYNACLRAGVEPDFVVVVDPQYWNTRHLDRARQTRSFLVSESSTHPRIFRLLPGKLFLAGSIFPLGSYLEEAADFKGRLGAGGSVATSAWDFARLLGSRPIVMAGLDLGFPGGSTHFTGSFFEERSFFTARRLSPAETHSCSYLFEAGPRPVPANDGSLTLTDRRMLVYVGWFASQLRLHPETETLTLSPGGVRIPGMRFAGIDSVLATADRRAAVDDRLAELRGIPAPPSDEKRFLEALGDLREELDRLSGLCRKGLAAVNRAAREPGGPGKAVLAELDGIDAEIGSLRLRDIAGFLLASVLADIARPERGSAAAVLANSRKVYAGLLESAEYHRRALDRAGGKGFKNSLFTADDETGGCITRPS